MDRPLTGRVFFEEIIRENLDLGRPSNVQLIFDRRVTKRTPGRFRTRVITKGVVPSLHVDYKHSGIKQYHKEGRGIRTETTINDTRDFEICKRLSNLPLLREVGFKANRRLLEVEKISHDCMIGEEAFQKVQCPVVVEGQRASGLPFGHVRVQALFHALLVVGPLACGFSNGDLRVLLAPLLGVAPSEITQGQMTYHLRRLRLHGLIRRIEHTHRYQLTEEGLRIVTFFSRSYNRLLRPELSKILSPTPIGDPKLVRAFASLERVISQRCEALSLAA